MAQTWIALLRGVNVGGTGKLPMADFRAALSAAGFGNVRSYIQSGNIILESELDHETIENRIKLVLQEEFGLDRPVLLRSVDQLRTALADNPFPQAEADPKTLHIMFLSGKVSLDEEALRAICDKGEAFSLTDQAFYLFTPNGFGRSKAAEKLERFLKAEAITARNLNSCQKILALSAN
jgi:uncharacterized protein (DUF1697 family)